MLNQCPDLSNSKNICGGNSVDLLTFYLQVNYKGQIDQCHQNNVSRLCHPILPSSCYLCMYVQGFLRGKHTYQPFRFNQNSLDFGASKPQKIGTFQFSEEKKNISLGNKVGIFDIFVVRAITCWYALFTCDVPSYGLVLTLLNPIVLCNTCSA